MYTINNSCKNNVLIFTRIAGVRVIIIMLIGTDICIMYNVFGQSELQNANWRLCWFVFRNLCKTMHVNYFVMNNLIFILLRKLCTFGSFIMIVHERGSALGSFTRMVNGNLFSLNARTTNLSCSPDLVTGTRFPANSTYTGLPSRT